MSAPLTETEALGESHVQRLAGAAQAIAARLVVDPARRAEQLGEIFLVCEQLARACPAEFEQALDSDALDAFLLPHVRENLRGEGAARFSGGWLGTYVGPDGRAIQSDDWEEGTTDPEALELSVSALQRAISNAQVQGNETMLRNLRWYRERLAHKSYEAIAREEHKVPGTVRTGVARARKYVLRTVHELQHAQPAPLNGDFPPQLEPLRRLWFEQHLDSLARELERTRSYWQDNPHWLNLAALLAADRGRCGEASRLYHKALIFADAPSLRGSILNHLGNLIDDKGQIEDAQHVWRRANLLMPNAPAPLLNLLAAASKRQDYASAQHHIAQLSDLFNSGRLKPDERAYVCRRLQEKPELSWLRDTDAWRHGPARWIRGTRPPGPLCLEGLMHQETVEPLTC
jgi:tetratricopeptide (TPR) repeat protein